LSRHVCRRGAATDRHCTLSYIVRPFLLARFHYQFDFNK
jgi:hypothetical protein